MSNAYKPAGIFREIRTIKRWILVCDEDETSFDRKRHAILSYQICKKRFKEVKLFEETVMRFRKGMEWDHDDSFRIDITPFMDRITKKERT